jgi:hypothetical protein
LQPSGPRPRDRDALDAYVIRVIVNEHNRHWRRPWKRREHPSAELPESRSDDRHDVETHDALWRPVQSLPTRQRAAVVLRYHDALTTLLRETFEREAGNAPVVDRTHGAVRRAQQTRARRGSQPWRPVDDVERDLRELGLKVGRDGHRLVPGPATPRSPSGPPTSRPRSRAR